jgi:hypothetical protein
MPEIASGRRETHSNEAPLLLLAHGRYEALDGLGGHFVEHTDRLAQEQGRVHDNQSAVSAHILSRGLKIDSFAFRNLAAHF